MSKIYNQGCICQIYYIDIYIVISVSIKKGQLLKALFLRIIKNFYIPLTHLNND